MLPLACSTRRRRQLLEYMNEAKWRAALGAEELIGS
jgi:hypothetical protein